MISKEILNKKWFYFLSFALSGILTALSLVAPKFFGIFEWVALVPMALVLMRLALDKNVKLRFLYLYGLFFFMSFYLVIYHWFFYLYPLDFLGISNASALTIVFVAWIGLSLLQTLMAAILFVLFGLLARTAVVQKIKLLLPFLAAALWAVLEWTQTLGWIGVPWARLSLGQIEFLPMVQTVSLFGTYFITFVLVLVNFLVAFILLFGEKRRTAAIIAAGVFVVNLALGTVLFLSYSEGGEKVTVGIAQGNIPSGEKWHGMTTTAALEMYCDYTVELADKGAKIIVWPETAIPTELLDDQKKKDLLSTTAKENGVTVLVGTFTEDEKTGMQRNSIIMANPDGSISETVYSKRHLVPFGEYVPMRPIITAIVPALTEINQTKSDLVPGDDSDLFDTEFGKIGSIICFDSIYEELSRDSTNDGAELLAISTNDSWFYDSAAVYMHNSQAKLRAIENGRCVVRSANTGVSSIINARGEVKSELGALIPGAITGEIEMRSNTTLYSVIGNLFVYIAIAFIVSVPAFDITKKILRGKSKQ